MNDFESIYRTYFADVYRYAKSLAIDEQTAQDITEETFIRAMRSLDSFRGDCEIRVWLCHIAKNVFLTEQKRKSRFVADDSILQEMPDTEDFTSDVEDEQTAIRIHRALHAMEEPYKEVFSLRVFGELSFREIGDLFAKTEHWACVTFHRAKAKIQQKMGDFL